MKLVLTQFPFKKETLIIGQFHLLLILGLKKKKKKKKKKISVRVYPLTFSFKSTFAA